MDQRPCIIKRRGHEEPYDERKAYGSIYGAARVGGYSEQKAEALASEICTIVTPWVHETLANGSPTSEDLKQKIHELIETRDREIAYLYLTHLDVN